MASLYKKPVTVTDPKTGERIKTKSKKWWGRYREENGQDRRVPLARDKAAAQAMLNELVLKSEREAAGQLDPFEQHAKRPLKELIDDFEMHLRDKGNSDQHVGELVRCIVAHEQVEPERHPPLASNPFQHGPEELHRRVCLVLPAHGLEPQVQQQRAEVLDPDEVADRGIGGPGHGEQRVAL